LIRRASRTVKRFRIDPSARTRSSDSSRWRRATKGGEARCFEIVERGAVAPAELQQVPKSPRGDERDEGAAPFENGVGGHGRAVHHRSRAAGVDGGETVENRELRGRRRGRQLVDPETRVAGHGHQVGEGPAGVDPDDLHRLRFRFDPG